jgi:hypothetical protein
MEEETLSPPPAQLPRSERRRPGLAPLCSGGFVLTGSPIDSRRKFESGFVLRFFWFKRRRRRNTGFHFILSFFLRASRVAV